MTLTRRLILACGVALVLPASLGGQPSRPGYIARTDGRLLMEGLFSRHQVARGGDVDSRSALDGFGGRLLWAFAAPEAPARGWKDRLYAGIYVLGGSDPTNSARTRHSGAQVDLRFGRERRPGMEPLLSLGAGVFRTTSQVWREVTVPRIMRTESPDIVGSAAMTAVRRSLPVTQAWTSLAVTPGVGMRLRLSPDFAIRLDARDVMAFRAPVRHTPELAGGLSLRL